MKVKSFLSGDSLDNRVARGSVLTALSFGAQNIIRLAGNLALTRILFPEAFGIMALVQVVMTGLNMFSDLGIRPAIIQSPRGDDPVFLNTAWIIQIIRGFVLWAIVWAAAAPIADFYEAPILAELLPVAGLAAVFQGFGSTKLATANRALTLGRMTVLNVSAQVVGLIVIVGLALWWESVWALVIGGLVTPLIIAILSHIVLPGEINRFEFEKHASGQLIKFGKYVFLATVAGFMVSQADRAILGKVITLEELALYTIAFFFASVPLLMMSKFVENVIFPLYSSAPPDQSLENKQKINKLRIYLAGGCLTVLGFLAVVGNHLIILLYDPRYEMAGPLLVLIAISQMFPLITASYSNLPLASGHSGRFAVLTFFSAGFRTIALLVGATQFGMIGVICAPMIATICFYPILISLTKRYSGWDPKHDVGVLIVSICFAAIALWFNPLAVAELTKVFL